MTSSISLTGLEFFAYHGYYSEERELGNLYEVDVTIWLDVDMAAETDDLAYTVSYERIYDLTKEVMTGEGALLEFMAGEIIRKIKSHFPEIEEVNVKVSKHNPPIGGRCKLATVSITG